METQEGEQLKTKRMEVLPLLFSFKGRIRRVQFTKWWLTLTLITLPLYYLNEQLAGMITIFLFWPLFALTTKRYYDFNSFGWLGIFQLLPIIGWLIIIVGCCSTVGDFKDNKYGKSLYK